LRIEAQREWFARAPTCVRAAGFLSPDANPVSGKEKQGDNHMSRVNRTHNSLDVLFRPASHYDAPEQVLNDTELSIAEKRVILSSWASDIYTVESCPWLREVPGIAQPIALKDILAALRQLDPKDDDDPPPRGATGMRVVPLIRSTLRRKRQPPWSARDVRIARRA
jgi:hypothetical protein